MVGVVDAITRETDLLQDHGVQDSPWGFQQVPFFKRIAGEVWWSGAYARYGEQGAVRVEAFAGGLFPQAKNSFQNKVVIKKSAFSKF